MNSQFRTVEELGDFPKGRESIRARIIDTGKQRLLDIRAFYQDDTGKWKPTRRGLSIPEDLQEDFRITVSHLCDRATALREAGK